MADTTKVAGKPLEQQLKESVDNGYQLFEQLVKERALYSSRPWFTTDVDPEKLWLAYLLNLPEADQPHYACNTCRRFVERYGGLTTLDENMLVNPLLWGNVGDQTPSYFQRSVEVMHSLVKKAKVTGVFYSNDPVLGSPANKDSKRPGIVWTHLACSNMKPLPRPLDADQVMAEKKEEYRLLASSLGDFRLDHYQQAVRLLQAEVLGRDEKALGMSQWVLRLVEELTPLRGSRRANRVWLATAEAPPGFCHFKNTMLGTLLTDLKEGLGVEAIKAKWGKKMHPLQYQRPQAAPREGQVVAAEKLVEKLEIAPALRRRAARLEDVLAFVWQPRTEAAPAAPQGGVFSHLRPSARPGPTIDLPTAAMTWAKFTRDVLPTASNLKILCPRFGRYVGLTTAVDSSAPPIMQWDGLAGLPRNPVSFYTYVNGSFADDWNISVGFYEAYKPLTGIVENPAHWQRPDQFKHHPRTLIFLIDGCRDTQQPNLALFPEDLKAELREARSVVEAHSRSQKQEVVANLGSHAAGLGFTGSGGRESVTLRVVTPQGWATYVIDRFE